MGQSQKNSSISYYTVFYFFSAAGPVSLANQLVSITVITAFLKQIDLSS